MTISYNKMGTKDNPYNLHYYNPKDFFQFLADYVYTPECKVKTVNKQGKTYKLLDTVVSFDTETTSTRVPLNIAEKFDPEFKVYFEMIKNASNAEFQDINDHGGVPFAFVYIWQLGFGKEVWIGRNFEEFIECVNLIKRFLYSIDHDLRMIIWVQNFKFEWSFLKTYFKWSDYLFIKPSVILYAITDNIEFRCTFLLSGKSLGKISEDITNEIYKKRTGDLDYEKVRLPITPLTDTELEYCIYDVLTVNEYVLEYMNFEHYVSFDELPYTKTGRVRKKMRSRTTGSKDENIRNNYKTLMKKAKMSVLEYDLLNKVFQGGFTHANAFKFNKKVRAKAYDITSSYPFVMTTQLFPTGAPTYFVNDEVDFDKVVLTHNKAYVFIVEFKNVRTKPGVYDHFWSVSKVDPVSLHDEIVDNGRIVSCSSMTTAMTDIDYDMFRRCYDFDYSYITSGYYYEYDYLPREFIMVILEYYGDKTTLKGVAGEEQNYVLKKEDTNSNYGMIAQNPIKPKIILLDNGETQKIALDDAEINEAIEKYNNKYGRFISYAWAPWVTSYARFRLWELILANGPAHIYSDTDSEYADYDSDVDKHVVKLNEKALQQIKTASKVLNIPISMYSPKQKIFDKVTKELIGEKEVTLGLWDYDGVFDIKTLGAKRYMKYDLRKEEWKLTVSGIRPKEGMEYILYKAEMENKDPFDIFELEMVFDSNAPIFEGKTKPYTAHHMGGPNSLHYAPVEDDYGNKQVIHSPSWTHLESGSYTLNWANEYRQYLNSADFEYVAKSIN